MVGILKLSIAIIILTLLVTYAITPFVKYIQKFLTIEVKRIDKSLTHKIEEDDKNNE